MIKLSSLYELVASAKIRSAKEASRHPAFMDKYPVDWARWAYMPIVAKATETQMGVPNESCP